ncbi:MAG: single-stranded DNA-binding protein [Patescibacteria group bacterium]|nr:single-stranded DNA-binding protein [Patescibacteria group bacterium]
MASLNRAMVIGNLTRDPELRTTSTGRSVVSFGVATNHSWTGADGQKQERAEFHNVVAWGKLAEIINQYLRKGRKVYIDGRLQTSDWQGQDGLKRYRTEIIADNMVMLDRAPQGEGSYPSAGAGPVEQPTAINEPPIPVIQQDAPTPLETKTEEVPF